jgi:hypothetical protein
MSVLDEIRGRRDVTVEQMLMALELVPESDNDTRRHLLAVASRGLGDTRVAARWLGLASEEADDDLRADMIARLTALEPGQIPDVEAFVRLLVAAVGPERTRALALRALDRLARVAPLVDAFRAERLRDVQQLILLALARHHDPPLEVIELFSSVLDACDADIKPLLLDRLLRAGALDVERLPALLRPTEPVAVRLRGLDHLVDRALDIDVREVVARDPHPDCRIAAIRVLAASGDTGAEVIVDVLRHDPDERARGAAWGAFEYALDLTPATTDALLQALVEERSTDLVERIIRILTPHVGRSAAVRAALQDLLARNLDAEVAVALWRTLGRLVAWDEDVRTLFTGAIDDQRHDRVREAILEALAGVADPDDRLVGLYRSAIESPDGRIRDWGGRGLRLVSMDEEHADDVAAAAGALLDREIDWHVRLDLARKIAAIPDKSPALVVALERAAEQTEGELRVVCRKAHDDAAAAQGGEAIDWEGWFRRVDVEKDVKGIFPAVFLHYDANPAAARRILQAALAPDCSNALYASQVSGSQILDFLAVKHAIDDHISRYCVGFILGGESNHANPNHHLALLKGNLEFPALRESLWQILDRRTDVDPVLMRELLLLVHPDEAGVAAQLRERLLSRTNPRQALPYLKFLEGNAAWEPAEAIILEVPPALVDGDTRRILDEAYRHLKREPPTAKASGPGFADE